MLLGIFVAFIVLVCIALAGVVLLQRSEGGALGMGGGPSGFLTTRGAGDLLTRTTWILGGLLFALCLVMAIVQGRMRGSASVVDRVKLDPSSVPAPAFPQPAAAPAANTTAPTAPATDGFGPPPPTVNVAPAAPAALAPAPTASAPATFAPAAKPASTAPGAVTVKPARTKPATAVGAPTPSVTVAPARGASKAQTPPDTNTGPTDPVAKTVGGLPAPAAAPAPKTSTSATPNGTSPGL